MNHVNSIIAKSLTGTASEEELEILQEWLLEDTQNEQLFQELHRYWHSETPKDVNKLNQKWASLQRIKQEKISKPKPLPTIGRRRVFPLWRVAAAILLLVGVGIWLFLFLFLWNGINEGVLKAENMAFITSVALRK